MILPSISIRILLALGLAGAIALNAEPGVPVLMGAMGDSISVASFANHSLVAIPATRLKLPPKSIIPFLGKWENKNYSWSTGEDISSHYSRLKQWLESRGSKLMGYNVAIAGSKTRDLVDQAQNLYEAMQSGEFSELKYVTLMIGANDACSRETRTGTPDEEMADEIEAALRILAQIHQAEPIKILVSAIPNIPALARAEVANTRTVFGLRCQVLRDKLLHECDPLTHWKTKAEFLEKQNQVIEKNLVLKAVVNEMNLELPNLDLYYSDAFYQANMPTGYLARDCFHPNATGQTQLSKILWNAQPWFH